LTIDNVEVREFDVTGIRTQNSGWVVTNCYIHDCDNYGIEVDGLRHRISDNYLTGMGQAGIFFSEANLSTADGNVCESNGEYGIFVFGDFRITVTGNICYNNTLDGIAASGSTGEPQQVTIVSNVSSANGGWGIWVGDGVSGDSTHVVVVGNVTIGNGSGGVGGGNSTTVISDNQGDTTNRNPLQLHSFWQSGDLTTGTGVFILPFDFAAQLVSVRLGVGTSPTGDDLIVDVNKNGTTMFTTQANRPTVPDGDADGVGASATPDVTAIAAGDYLSVDIDQIGSTTPGSNLTVVIAFQAA
ncbi:MAG: right-handed parallel beta-helix repeat-containing protein, partial [Saprospiraceae bacterium]|nr:right-handed parallel beta-helix repeat-containing protein [Saprospiraceae bacterium]